MTSKGKLIRAILFPKPIHFRFYADLVKAAGLFLNRQQTEWTTNNMNKQN